MRGIVSGAGEGVRLLKGWLKQGYLRQLAPPTSSSAPAATLYAVDAVFQFTHPSSWPKDEPAVASSPRAPSSRPTTPTPSDASDSRTTGSRTSTPGGALTPVVPLAASAARPSAGGVSPGSPALLPKLKGFLEVYQEQGLFGSVWRKRYVLVQKKAKAILMYPESMEAVLESIPLARMANIGPTGDGWSFQIFLSVKQKNETAGVVRRASDAREGRDTGGAGASYMSSTFSQVYTLRAKSQAEMKYWVDGLIRWVDHIRSAEEATAARRAKQRKSDVKRTLLTELDQRLTSRIADDVTRRTDTLQRQVTALTEEMARLRKQKADLSVRNTELELALVSDGRSTNTADNESQRIAELEAELAKKSAQLEAQFDLLSSLEEETKTLRESEAALLRENEVLLDKLAEMSLAAGLDDEDAEEEGEEEEEEEDETN